MKNLKQEILNKIKSGELDMKPRWHFVLKGLLLISFVLTTVLVTIYLLSFIFFTLRQNGVGFGPLYGFRGISMFVMNAPWLLIVSTLSLIVVLQTLVRRYSFNYHQPLLYSLIGIITLVLFGAYAIEQTVMHQRLQGFAEQHKIPVFEPMYRRIDANRPENLIMGSIIEVNETGFILGSDRGENLTIVISNETKQRLGAQYTVSENVLVFGDREGDIVAALGIRPAPKNFDSDKFNKKRR